MNLFSIFLEFVHLFVILYNSYLTIYLLYRMQKSNIALLFFYILNEFDETGRFAAIPVLFNSWVANQIWVAVKFYWVTDDFSCVKINH